MSKIFRKKKSKMKASSENEKDETDGGLRMLNAILCNDYTEVLNLAKQGYWNINAFNIAKVNNLQVADDILKNHPSKKLTES